MKAKDVKRLKLVKLTPPNSTKGRIKVDANPYVAVLPVNSLRPKK